MSPDVLLALALAGGAAPPAGPPAGTDVELEEVAARLQEGGLRASPLLARRRGLQPPPPSEPEPPGTLPWSATLANLEDALGSTRFAVLSPAEAVLRDALLARVEAERVLARGLPRERWDPLLFVERARELVGRVAAAPAAQRPPLLAEVPALWRLAERTLASPRRGWTEDAMEAVSALARRLEALAPDAVETDGAEAWDEALRATRSFEEWLREATTRFGEPIPRLGPRDWHELVAATSGTELDPTALRVRVLRELARLDTELGDEREIVVPDEPPAPAATARRAEETARGIFAALVDARLLPPREVPFEVRLAPSPELPLPLCRLSTEDGRHVLELVPPAEDWPLLARRTREALFRPFPLVARVLRDGPPGEALLRTLAAGERAQPFVWNRAVLEGWGLYALDWPARTPPTASALGHAPLHAELVRARLLEAARLLAAMEWHALERPVADATEAFSARTGLDLTTATLEVRRATRDPLLGIGFLGWLEIVALERALAEDDDPRAALRRTLRLVSADPRLRPADLRRALAPGEDG